MPYFDKIMESRKEARRARKTVVRLQADLAEAMAQLTDRQRRFCEICGGPPGWGSAYRAAEAAGYATPRSEGSRLVSMFKVRRALLIGRDLAGARRRLEQAKREHAAWMRHQREAIRQDAIDQAEAAAWVAARLRGENPDAPKKPARKRLSRAKRLDPTRISQS